MNRHLGATYAISVLIVVVVAVVFRRLEPVVAPSPLKTAAKAEPASSAVRSISKVETRSPTVPPAKRGAFTTARANETIEAVAVRVYGSADADVIDDLLRANRDQVPSRSSALHEGMPIRTP